MSTLRAGFDPAPLPSAYLTHEDFLLIWRLLQKGSVNLEMAISNTFSEVPREVPNVVAEIPGAVHLDEVVIICAHLDSWDLGTGATDDGAGVVAVLEAARALQALHLRPDRTIRLVLFSGEEEGNQGSLAYVKSHAPELNRISAVLADDTAASRIDTLRLNQAYAARRDVDLTLASMAELQLLAPRMDRGFGSDYASFNAMGVPAFAAISTDSAYFRVHHSQADTLDKIQPDGILSAAEVLAGWAYNTAQLPELLPRN
jgi:Zn-dependent M28 family amino/carboxypeptidase